jgi:hypothetical protein
VEVSELDLLESQYLEEYHLVINKDREAGKDFNMIAMDTMLRKKYFFQHLRENEYKYGSKPHPKALKPRVQTDHKDTVIDLNVEEKELFKSPASSRAQDVLKEAGLDSANSGGRLLSKFREQFKDIYEERLDS